MKKLLLIVVATFFVSNLFAQDLQKNIFGIKAGANYSTFEISGIELGYTVGVNGGLSYERLLAKNIPMYLETGLLYSGKGMESAYFFDEGKYKLSLHFLQVPLMLNYKFNISKSFSIYPSVGLYFGFAVAGIEKDIYESQYGTTIDTYNIFEEGDFPRPDFGCRFSLSFALKRFVLSAGYEKSILAIGDESSDYYDEISLGGKFSNYFVSLGVNF